MGPLPVMHFLNQRSVAVQDADFLSRAMIAEYRDETAPIRILIAAMPALLASVVRDTLDAERDMVVVGQVDSIDEFTGRLESIDVVVTTSTPTGVPVGLRHCSSVQGRYRWSRSAPMEVVSTCTDAPSCMDKGWKD